jgi:hypothetical protein
MASRDSGCGGCLALIAVLALIGALVQAVTWLWVNFWPEITGIGLSVISMALLKKWHSEDLEQEDTN